MRLSNTAVPYYYGLFRDKVLRGEIPVNREIAQHMANIDQIIADPRYYYDPRPVEGWINFCESEMTLVDGSDVEVLDSFKLWYEDLYCWYYFIERQIYEPYPDGKGGHYVTKQIKKRLRNKQYLIIGRGAAKSLYDTWVQAYEHDINPETTQQITVAPTMRLADAVMSPYRTAISKSRGPLYKFLTKGSLNNTTGSAKNRQKLASTKQGIVNILTNSILEVLPMSIDKLQGLRPKVSTVDEWLSGDTREDPIGAIEQGASKVHDYVIVATSSEGTVRNGPGDDIKIELRKILSREYSNPHVSIWWYKLDSIDEVKYPEMWRKANPNLGITVSYDTYQLDVERAEQVPSQRNDILAKRFGLEMEGYTYFFTYEETVAGPPKDFWGMPCSLGVDLSQGDDFCAFDFLFPLPGGQFGLKALSYITSNTFLKLPGSLRSKYETFIDEGSLVIMEGVKLDLDDVYDDLWRKIENAKYDVRTLGYDPYNAKSFVNRWELDNGPYGMEKVIQGVKTESVPLGEIKHMTENRMILFDQQIMQYTMGNAIVIEDTNGNRKLHKKRYEYKIDNVSALIDAYVAYSLHKDLFD